MIAQAKGRVGSTLPLLIARLVIAINIEGLWIGKEFWQEMRGRHRNIHIIARFQAIPGKGEGLCDACFMAFSYRVKAQRFYRSSMQCLHRFQQLPGERSLRKRSINLSNNTLQGLWVFEERIEHETRAISNCIQSGEKRP